VIDARGYILTNFHVVEGARPSKLCSAINPTTLQNSSAPTSATTSLS